MVTIYSQPMQSSCRSELVDLFASRLVHEEDYQKPSHLNLYQKVQAIFHNIFPDPSVIHSWHYDPNTHDFEIELTQPHQRGNYWSSFHYAPKIIGHLEPIEGENKYRIVIEKGIKGSVYSWRRALGALHLDQDRFHISLQEGVLWKKNFSGPVEKLLAHTEDFQIKA